MKFDNTSVDTSATLSVTSWVTPATEATHERTKVSTMNVQSRLRRFATTAMLLLSPVMLPAMLVNTAHAEPTKVSLRQQVDSVIVPDKFLRRWDPVTIFFDKATGPAKGGPEYDAQRYVTMTPAHPGAFTWLDANTLQYRPIEAWPPLTRFEFNLKQQGDKHVLNTLMSAPLSTNPRQGATGLSPVSELTLDFPEPLDHASLVEMLTIELRGLPGVQDGQARWLDKDDFEVKIIERRSPSDKARYVVLFNNPIPSGVRAITHLRLSLDDQSAKSFAKVAFSTAAPFRLKNFGCGYSNLPVSASGVHYSQDQALTCNSRYRRISLNFSASLKSPDAVLARNLVRLTPTVPNLQYSVSGSELQIRGEFDAETLYQVRLEPAALFDDLGRGLDMKAASSGYVYFPAREDYLKFSRDSALLERYGPKMVPIQGRGFSRVDLRVHAIDPLNRSLWPINGLVSVNEQARPPSPGEEPEPFDEEYAHISNSQLRQQIAALGSPNVSDIVELPLKTSGGAADFGLDLTPHLKRIHGDMAPGHYLVGIRKLDIEPRRSWMRVQVTDLAVTTTEDRETVRFYVTSIKSAKPMAGATVKIEGGYRDGKKHFWGTLAEGKTNSEGVFEWNVFEDSHRRREYFRIMRLVVQKDKDTLVLQPRKTERFSDGAWRQYGTHWVNWSTARPSLRDSARTSRCHIFTERPIYRPDEPTFIKGYVRTLNEGRMSHYDGEVVLVVRGPGKEKWEYELELNEHGSFDHKFDEKKLPTGQFRAYIADINCRVNFKREAYRVPRFEVNMNGPKRTSIDKPFTVNLNAEYYAGGPVAKQSVRWRVTQFPFYWAPKGRKGFAFSTDSRYSNLRGLRSTSVLSETKETGLDGVSSIEIDPAKEPSARPRRYIVEATVIGADEQTVTNTHQVEALPPFALGIKAPRYLPEAKVIEPEVVAVDYNNKNVEGRKLTLTLSRREWHSHLQAGDFSRGEAKYVTEVVDKKLLEKTVISAKEVSKLKLPIDQAGVYILELSAQDELGRAQSVKVDLYAGGEAPVAWERPVAKVFKLSTNKKKYTPGDTAKVVIQSPYQSGEALVIIEKPSRNVYKWLTVNKGQASFEVPVKKRFLPNIPVHVVLMRGRVKGTKPAKLGMIDLGKPATVASTTYIKVDDSAHRVKIELAHPDKVQPGDMVEMSIKLTDSKGKPRAGEVTLWMVDQAVLALAAEQSLDPLTDFIVDRGSRVVIHDMRNRVIGVLPYREREGGDMALEEEAKELEDNVTVRKNFKTVAYYNPVIEVDESGETKIKIQMPDNLTNFMIRAKAVAGASRFGFVKGKIQVRLPVIVQPALPRFLRIGDEFVAIGIGRIVDGDGGAGLAIIRSEQLTFSSDNKQKLAWDKTLPAIINFPAAVKMPTYNENGELSFNKVSIKMAVNRDSDNGRDAFEVSLPLLPDRQFEISRWMGEIKAGQSVEIPALAEKARQGTVLRSVMLTNNPSLVRMAAGLSYLMDYPHGCTEQQVSRARAYVATKRFGEVLQVLDAKEVDRAVNETLKVIGQRVTSNNLVAYWPGSEGYVSLTAWSVEFMAEARDAGYEVDNDLLYRLTRSLKQALRSDYQYLLSGEQYTERAQSLQVLARLGQIDKGYAAELASDAEFLPLEAAAMVYYSLQSSGQMTDKIRQQLEKRMFDGIVFQLYQGNEKYRGLQAGNSSRDARILPSETRTVARVARALVKGSENPRKTLLVDALVTLGEGDGWGSTQANASALLALTDVMKNGGGEQHDAQISVAGKDDAVALGKKALDARSYRDAGAITLSSKAGDDAQPLLGRVVSKYLPEALGNTAAANAKGFVVTRSHQFNLSESSNKMANTVVLDNAGTVRAYEVGDIVEDVVEIVNPENRHFVAIVVPLAAGMEPLNPVLKTAPPEATPSTPISLKPTYVAFMDDHMAYYYNSLPKGTYRVAFRARAQVPGRYTQPSAYAEMMYKEDVRGAGNGATVLITPKAK